MPNPRAGTRARTPSGAKVRKQKGTNYLVYSHLGMTFAVTFAACFCGGLYLDNLWRTDPWLTLLGFLTGFLAAMSGLAKSIGKKRALAA